jgi:hypothetical protein
MGRATATEQDYCRDYHLLWHGVLDRSVLEAGRQLSANCVVAEQLSRIVSGLPLIGTMFEGGWFPMPMTLGERR